MKAQRKVRKSKAKGSEIQQRCRKLREKNKMWRVFPEARSRPWSAALTPTLLSQKTHK